MAAFSSLVDGRVTRRALGRWRMYVCLHVCVYARAGVCVYDKHLTRNARQTLITLVISRQTRVTV